jgi:putative resolvase
VNLKEWAVAQGVHPQTAYRWFREATLPVPARRVGPRMILVNPDAVVVAKTEGVGLYARVSSHDQKADLDRQTARLTAWAADAGCRVLRSEAEVGSGMNGARTKIRRLLADPEVTVIVVEHRDRLGRMNTELVEATLSAHGRRLVILDDGEVTDDLVRDMVEVLTWFCARLYGRRSARSRALKALECAQRDTGPAAVVGGVGQEGGHGCQSPSGSDTWTQLPSPGRRQFVALDAAGNVYVVRSGDTGGVVKLAPGSSDWTELPGEHRFVDPQGLAVDTRGNVYVTDHTGDRAQAFFFKWPVTEDNAQGFVVRLPAG